MTTQQSPHESHFYKQYFENVSTCPESNPQVNRHDLNKAVQMWLLVSLGNDSSSITKVKVTLSKKCRRRWCVQEGVTVFLRGQPLNEITMLGWMARS